jgi:hypothetical protein
MRWKTTVLLALILLALGSFYYVYEIRLAPGREKSDRDKGRLWRVEVKDVEEVVFKRSGDTVHLRRSGDGWALLSPVKSGGDKRAVEDLLATLVTAKVEREIDPNPAKLAHFDLDAPAADITVTVKGKSEALTLLLGGRNPTGVWAYAKTGESPSVFLVSDLVLRDATKPAIDFRDKTVLAFERKDVTGLEIREGGRLMAAEPEAPARWKITKPAPFRADWDRLSDFLDKVQFTKVKEFVAESPKSLGPYGLDRPTSVTVFVGKGKDRTVRELLLGRVDPAKKGVYALRKGEQSVLLLDEQIWNLLPKTLAELRDKTVLSYDREKVARFEIESPRGKVAVAKDGEKWTLTTPEPLKADGGEVSNLLWKLKDLKGQAIVADGAGAVTRYLAKPEVKLTLWEEGAQAPKTLLLAPSPERRDGGPMAYAALAGQGPVMLVQGNLLRDLAKSAFDLRDRSLFEFFDTKEVRRLRLRGGGQTMVIEQKSENDWRVLEPKKGKGRESRILDLLRLMRTLKWGSVASSSGGEDSRYGFDTPAFELTLLKADGSEIGGLVVGRKENGKTYVKTKGSSAVYSVDSKLVGDLPRVPDDLQQ